MTVDIELIIIWLAISLLGVWYFFAGLKGWENPRLKGELDGDNEKIIFRMVKIICGIIMVILGIAGIITEVTNYDFLTAALSAITNCI